MVLTGLSHLAAADPTAMAAQAQAECLLALEQGDAMSAAARAQILAAFTASRGYSADGVLQPGLLADPPHPDHQGRGPRSPGLGPPRLPRTRRWWRRWPRATVLTESMARTICGWTDKLPADCRQSRPMTS